MSHWVEDKLRCRDYDLLTKILKEFGYEVEVGNTVVKNEWKKGEEDYSKDCDLIFSSPKLLEEIDKNWKTKVEGHKIGVKDGELIYDPMYVHNHKKIKEEYIQETSKKELLKQGFQVKEKDGEITGNRFHNGRQESVNVYYRTTNKDTEVRVETTGFTGRRCVEATSNLEKNLGVNTEIKHKAEYYQKDPSEKIYLNSKGLCG